MKPLAAFTLFFFLWLTARPQSSVGYSTTYYCSFCNKGPFATYEAGIAHTCAVHNWGCAATITIPAGPSAAELKKRKEEKDLKEAAQDANDKGIDCYKKSDWVCAITHFLEALGYDPDNEDAQYNLRKAKEEKSKEEARFRTKLIERRVPDEPKKDGLSETEINNTILQTVQGDRFKYNKQLRKLMSDISRIKVPPPPVPKKIHEGVILGLFNTNTINAITDSTKNVSSSFTGKKYKADEFFATSDKLSAMELLRGVIDNSYLGEYTLNTAHGKKLIERLQGTTFDRLIAHSNGATVSEALIRKGVITVNELNIVGGDRSLINNTGLQELIATGKVKRVVVWVNPGDIIPYGSSAGLMAPLAGARDQYIKAAASYFATILTGQDQSGDSKVEYRFLKGKEYEGQEMKFGKDIFNAHGLEIYLRNMRKYFELHSKVNN